MDPIRRHLWQKHKNENWGGNIVVLSKLIKLILVKTSISYRTVLRWMAESSVKYIWEPNNNENQFPLCV